MADTKISLLPAATTLSGAELLAGVQSAGNVKITATQLLTYITTDIGWVTNGSTTTLTGSPTILGSKVIFKNGNLFEPVDGAGVEIQDATHNSNGAILDFYSTLATVTNDRIYEIHGYIPNSSGTKKQMTAIYANNGGNTAGDENGEQLMNITSHGSLGVYFDATAGTSAADVNLTLSDFALLKKIGGSGAGKLLMGPNRTATSTSYFRFDQSIAGQFLNGFTNTNASGYTEFNLSNDSDLAFSSGLRLAKFNSGVAAFGSIQPNGATVMTGTNLTYGLSLVAGASAGKIQFFSGGYSASELRMELSAAGRLGIGVTSASALLHLAAGTATASTAPMKFTAGTNLTTAETGAMEYNGTNLFFTRSGTTREGILTQSAVTTEVLVSDTSVTINIGGTTYKLLAKA